MMAKKEPNPPNNTPDRVPAFTNEDDLRSEFLPGVEGKPKRVYKAHAGSITPGKILRLILGLITLGLTWYLFLGPGKPTYGKFLDTIATMQPRPVTPTPTPTAIPFTPTPVPTTRQAVKDLPTATGNPLKPTATQSPTIELLSLTPTPTPTPTRTVASGVTGCVPAISVTLADVGKVMCVTGHVIRTATQANGFLITLENSKQAFYFISYDRTWDDLDMGTCIFATGEIKQLGNAPVMALSYTISLEFCP